MIDSMFNSPSLEGYRDALPGVRIKTLCYGERTLMTQFLMEGGSILPMHSHPHEQTGYLVSGRIRLTIGEDEMDVLPGASWCIGANVPHAAKIMENSAAIEVFSPVREDYLP